MTFSSPHKLYEYIKIKKLYKKAFPRSERKPFSIIKRMQMLGKTDIWYFSDEKGFLGFATTINSPDVILIDYFAVLGKRRGSGNGTKMLKKLIEHYSGCGIFLEIEIPDERAENYEERVKRKRFYMNAGLSPMNTRAKLFGVDMELMGSGCQLDFDEYRNFYRDNYSEFAYNNIKKTEEDT